MLPTGLHTPAESSPTVLKESTTPSYLPDITANTGSSKTLGEAHGENPDISDSLPVIPVPLLKIVLTHTIEKVNR